MKAEELILNSKLRPTKARLAILNIIADANSALSHPEILALLAEQTDFDRVTVYRVLEWLTEHELIHRISGENRAWKYQLSQAQFQPVNNQISKTMISQNHRHAHLHCKLCSQITCIHELEPHFPTSALNKYQVETVDINIKGVCLQCASLSKASSTPS